MSVEALIGKARFTVLIGKNGAGKSTLLRSLNIHRSQNIKYISPERGGTLKYDPTVDNNITVNLDWLRDTRNTNRFEQFRQQSAAQFRSLETAVLREIEQDAEKRADLHYTFDAILARVNDLLPAIKMVRNDRGGFSVQTKEGQAIDESQMSSGESELIALAIEVLVFSRQSSANKILLLDEPDVHMHPDLQQKFTAFVESVATDHDMRVVIATHSTAIIGAFSNKADLQIVPVSNRAQAQFNTFTRTAVCQEILPIFGSHPLSTAFNKSPVVLVEGDDDRRVLEQVVRSSNGRISMTPCVVGTVTDLSTWEDWLSQFLPVLYDSPKAFSLRDLDDGAVTAINDIAHVCRIRLNCYAIENLLLCDQTLAIHDFSADSFKRALEDWVERFPNHKYTGAMSALVQNFEHRRTANVKSVRNIIVALLGCEKPWEVLVGQQIAANISRVDASPNSLQTFLGSKAMERLFEAL